MDNQTKEQRHYTMSRIRGRDTKPELLVRKYLFGQGLRFRKNDKRLPGHPDIVFPKYRTVVFVNGCFWHGHEGCRYYVLPKSNCEFWSSKIERNKARDERDRLELESKGWRVVVVWECELKKSVRDATLKALYDSIVEEGGRCSSPLCGSKDGS